MAAVRPITCKLYGSIWTKYSQLLDWQRWSYPRACTVPRLDTLEFLCLGMCKGASLCQRSSDGKISAAFDIMKEQMQLRTTTVEIKKGH